LHGVASLDVVHAALVGLRLWHLVAMVLREIAWEQMA